MIDNAEFDAIYVKYKGQIHRYCYLKLGSLSMAKELAEEAANDVFMVLFDRWDELEKGDSIRAWLYKTAQNVVQNKLRTERRRAPQDYIEDFAAPDKVGEMSVTDEYFASEVTSERFAGYMKSRLTSDEYALFLERFIKKRTFDSIAKATGVPYSTVRLRCMKLEKSVRRGIRAFADDPTGG